MYDNESWVKKYNYFVSHFLFIFKAINVRELYII